jgi:hypothetical protein
MQSKEYKRFADLDETDLRITKERMAAFMADESPKVGDYVKFADGVERRISYIWRFEGKPSGTFSVQTSDGGSWYFGDGGYCSFSGSLYSGVPASTLKHTSSARRGSCWFFHHDHHCAHNGVGIQPPIFDGWTCSKGAPS